MVKVVPTSEVRVSEGVISQRLDKFKSLLLRDGMIEPLCVHQTESPPYHITGRRWTDNYYFMAAAALGWKTVIIAVDDEGE